MPMRRKRAAVGDESHPPAGAAVKLRLFQIELEVMEASTALMTAAAGAALPARFDAAMAKRCWLG